MDGAAFESMLAHLFGSMGFQVTTTPITGDQGADLIVERFGHRLAVQAKCYSTNVGNDAIQEAVAAVAYYGCHGAIVVTNRIFTPSARTLANANGVELWDRERLAIEIQRYL